MPVSTQTRTIRIVVDAPGVKSALDGISRSMGTLNKNTKSIVDSFKLLRNSFFGYLSLFGVREIARMSDEMQNLENRLKIVTTDGKASSDVLEEIADVARRTYQPINDVGDSFTRLASSLKGVGATTEQLSTLNETLINTFRISGATATETSNTLVQLSQAFSSGEVRGQELRSVLEQNAVLAGLLRKEFGTDLFKKAADGAIKASTIIRLLSQNIEELNAQAQVLNPTFEQTVNIAKNEMFLALHALNKELKLSIGFFTAITYVADNFKTILIALVPLIAVFAGAKLAALAASLSGVGAALSAVLLTNPVAWAVAAGAAFLYLTEQVGGLDNMILVLKNTWNDFNIVFLKGARQLAEFSGAKDTAKILTSMIEDLEKINQLNLDQAGFNLSSRMSTGKTRAIEDQKQQLEELANSLDNLNKKAKELKIKEILGELNQDLQSGAIAIDTYNSKLVNFEMYKLNREFREGKFDVFQYGERLNGLKIQDLNRNLKSGLITFQQYNQNVESLKIEELNKKFEAGKITLIEYNTELTKISSKFEPGSALVSGTNAYIESTGTLSENIANGIKNTFSALEDTFVDFIKRGKFNFHDFAQSVLDDLTRIIVRASIIQPIAQGILGLAVTPSAATGSQATYGTSTMPVAAKGLAFDKGIRKFASGGIVNSPTMFGYGKGQTGLMGEAGPEAIIPLKRGKGGDLGVQATVTPVTVNVINQTGSEVQQKETTGPNGEKTLEIIITGKVREGLLSGKYDKAMKSAYGLNRKGS